MTNAYLSEWNTPFNLPPFADLTDADVKPAVDAALAEGRAAIKATAEILYDLRTTWY